MASISDRDEAEVVERLGRDVTATLGPGHLELVRSTARHHRHFTDDDRDSYFARVVDDVQQDIHCGFVDTSWPACPEHPKHPMWFADGWWVADGQPLTRLGELGVARE